MEQTIEKIATADHGHGIGHHEEHHHVETFINKYIFSQDHKMIARQFLFTGMIWAIIGGLFSVLFRVQLGWPDATFPALEQLFGNWFTDGKLDPNAYYMLVTMHGTIMVFFVLTAGLSGTFANFLIPLQIGARDMASGFINMLSYWFFFASSVVMFSSFFVSGGAASGGWTIYPPLSALPQASSGSGAGMTLWLISMTLFIGSTLMGGLNYVSTVLNLRTKGMDLFRMPLTVWALFFTAIIGILSFPVLVSGVVLLVFDRTLGTSFYLSDIYIAGKALSNSGGSPILFQHLFWFLGHPEVYIVILPAMGMVSEILATNSRKPIFGYKAMVFSILGITILGFIVWAHHMFMSGMNPFIGSVFTLFTLLIAIPSAVKVFNWLTTLWRGNIRLNSASLFSIGFVSVFISGGVTGIWLGNAIIDVQLHDTYFVVAHFHIVMGIAAFFGMFAGVYHWFPKMFGRFMNETLGYVHFFVSFIGSYIIFWPMHYLGMSGVPRRYYSFKEFQAFSQYDDLNKIISMGAIMVFIAQLLFVANFVYSIYRGRKMTKDNLNPWQSNTLEWTTDVEPGHGNWKGAIPTVYRWAYDYSKNPTGPDFTPQNVPLTEEELANESKKH
ncbi:MAG: cbb3-type cytochrome c oxidase subunit I [Bacteroidetes bacterium]|jgi:cytochrome c oxidase subunit 1|nr:cbb3-type cytochrome c oxidase subunit I [Bacteroidota bacterium]MBP7255736.1 cbb3-type cytochrome c oxidase subunit I [Chitinophagales bacterium]